MPHMLAFDLPRLFSTGLQQMQRMQMGCAVLFGPMLSAAALSELQQQRLRKLIEHARRHAPLHAQRLSGLSPELPDLPVLTRGMLMQDFEASLCAPHPSTAEVSDWLYDSTCIGELLGERWQVWESSGTHGRAGWFVQDTAALAVYDALESLRGAAAGALNTLATNGRMALLVATGGHFASIAAFERLRRQHPWLTPQLRAFSILQPLPDLVQSLNDWQPQVLATYPTAAALLADQASAGHLQLRLRELWCGGETLRTTVRNRLAQTFGCRVRNNYGASEFFCMAGECAEGGLHLNADWAILEPVDERHQAVPTGVWPHTTLLTNLANYVQPLIRYDLGDRVRYTGQACACGSLLPLIEVQGREDETLQLLDEHDAPQSLLPLALSTVIEDQAGLIDYQLVQTGPRSLRLQLGSGDRAGLVRAERALRQWLKARGLGGVRIDGRLDCAPILGRSGKLQRVLSRRRH